MPTRECFSGRRPVRGVRRRWPAVLFALLALVMVVPGPGASAEPGDDGDTTSARAEHTQAQAALTEAQATVDRLYREHEQLGQQIAALGGDQRTVAQRVDDARSTVRRYALDAYISGSTAHVEESLLYEEAGHTLAYKTYFLRDRTDQFRTALAEQHEATRAIDARTSELTVSRARIADELNAANLQLDRAVQAFRAADARLRRAEHVANERARAAAAAKAASAPKPPTGGGGGSSGNAQGPGWDKLRQCEAGGNYAINTGNGYYGVYQFDLRTWRGLGGEGYPHQAAPAEQDRLAQKLFDQRGAQPWPVCGRYLL